MTMPVIWFRRIDWQRNKRGDLVSSEIVLYCVKSDGNYKEIMEQLMAENLGLC